MTEEQDKTHWHCFSFSGRQINGGASCYASCYIGFETKNISREDIKFAKQTAKVTNDAVLISVSYLGYMTRAEFVNDEDAAIDAQREKS